MKMATIQRTCVAVLITAVVTQAGSSLTAGETGEQCAATAEPTSEERVTHYAFLSTGPAFGERLGRLYWGVNNGMYEVLRQYGYPDEAIYRFGDYSGTRPEGVDGKATLENFRAAFVHLQRQLKPTDHVFIMLVGHGRFSEARDDFVHPLLDGNLSATELKDMVDNLPTNNLSIVVHPCHSGGFIPSLSCPGRVILTSTNEQEVNRVPWAEALVEALKPNGGNDLNGDGRVSLKEAYEAALQPAKERCGEDLEEHPLIDDNADGVGSYVAEEETVGGDGRLAAERFLGDDGEPLQFSANAVKRLREQNQAQRFDQ